MLDESLDEDLFTTGTGSPPRGEDSSAGSSSPPPGEYEVEIVLDRKKRRTTNNEVEYIYLIRWKGYAEEYDTWEPEDCLVNAPLKLEEFLEVKRMKKRRDKLTKEREQKRRWKENQKETRKVSEGKCSKRVVDDATMSASISAPRNETTNTDKEKEIKKKKRKLESSEASKTNSNTEREKEPEKTDESEEKEKKEEQLNNKDDSAQADIDKDTGPQITKQTQNAKTPIDIQSQNLINTPIPPSTSALLTQSGDTKKDEESQEKSKKEENLEANNDKNSAQAEIDKVTETTKQTGNTETPIKIQPPTHSTPTTHNEPSPSAFVVTQNNVSGEEASVQSEADPVEIGKERRVTECEIGPSRGLTKRKSVEEGEVLSSTDGEGDTENRELDTAPTDAVMEISINGNPTHDNVIENVMLMEVPEKESEKRNEEENNKEKEIEGKEIKGKENEEKEIKEKENEEKENEEKENEERIEEMKKDNAESSAEKAETINQMDTENDVNSDVEMKEEAIVGKEVEHSGEKSDDDDNDDTEIGTSRIPIGMLFSDHNEISQSESESSSDEDEFSVFPSSDDDQDDMELSKELMGEDYIRRREKLNRDLHRIQAEYEADENAFNCLLDPDAHFPLPLEDLYQNDEMMTEIRLLYREAGIGGIDQWKNDQIKQMENENICFTKRIKAAVAFGDLNRFLTLYRQWLESEQIQDYETLDPDSAWTPSAGQDLRNRLEQERLYARKAAKYYAMLEDLENWGAEDNLSLLMVASWKRPNIDRCTNSDNHGWCRIISFLAGRLCRGFVERRSESGLTALRISVRAGSMCQSEALIDCGARVSSKDDSKGWEPLHEAVFQMRENRTEYLVKKGANISAEESLSCIIPRQTIRLVVGPYVPSPPISLRLKNQANDLNVQFNSWVKKYVGKLARCRIPLLAVRPLSPVHTFPVRDAWGGHSFRFSVRLKNVHDDHVFVDTPADNVNKCENSKEARNRPRTTTKKPILFIFEGVYSEPTSDGSRLLPAHTLMCTEKNFKSGIPHAETIKVNNISQRPLEPLNHEQMTFIGMRMVQMWDMRPVKEGRNEVEVVLSSSQPSDTLLVFAQVWSCELALEREVESVEGTDKKTQISPRPFHNPALS